jgi:hypothetical protein
MLKLLKLVLEIRAVIEISKDGNVSKRKRLLRKPQIDLN